MLYRLIDTFFDILYWLIIIRVIISWIRPAIRDPRYYKALRLLYELTEPILEPIRRYMPTGIGIDFSPFVALIFLSIIKNILLSILF
ncbi:hypothetical protein BBF96_06185 [Anoxybacter fermentans]|uniref:YggT family protein n=1 Tax=Anoxybacter fermentans TaxID=1323375 RepID=A0A3Q9HQ31_9FIRM|nr:YggT family protein [Anoxybacter fermentans]AZR73021.1 hypothetical protein BBF96_06185 [Anoxybacter fermentans]